MRSISEGSAATEASRVFLPSNRAEKCMPTHRPAKDDHCDRKPGLGGRQGYNEYHSGDRHPASRADDEDKRDLERKGGASQKTKYRFEDLVLWWSLMRRRASAGGMLESLQSLLVCVRCRT
jgi:hypothetical protein